jgi:hypothetical protein
MITTTAEIKKHLVAVTYTQKADLSIVYTAHFDFGASETLLVSNGSKIFNTAIITANKAKRLCKGIKGHFLFSENPNRKIEKYNTELFRIEIKEESPAVLADICRRAAAQRMNYSDGKINKMYLLAREMKAKRVENGEPLY